MSVIYFLIFFITSGLRSVTLIQYVRRVQLKIRDIHMQEQWPPLDQMEKERKGEHLDRQ